MSGAESSCGGPWRALPYGGTGGSNPSRERTMTMPTWPVRFDGVPTAVKSAPVLGEHTAEVLADWLGLAAAAVARLRQDGIVSRAGGLLAARRPRPVGSPYGLAASTAVDT